MLININSSTMHRNEKNVSVQMKIFDKDSNRQFSQVMENILKRTIQKESRTNLLDKQNRQHRSSYHSIHMHESESGKNTIQIAKQQEKMKQQKINQKSKSLIDSKQVKKIPYKFSFKAYLLEILVAYAVTFSILYLIKLGNFPYFELILIIAFTASIEPWRKSNVIMLVSIAVVIADYFLKISFFTYPTIVIFYLAIMSFNQSKKIKIIFVFTLVFTLLYGFLVLPAIYQSISRQKREIVYPYVFPILSFLLRSVLNYSYYVIGHTEIIFLQLPFFISGLQYGTILTLQPSSIQFWYLMVFFTLQIINDRSLFMVKIMDKIVQNWFQKDRKQDQILKQQKKYPILPAHMNGYACTHSFHIFIIIYIYTYLNLFTAPYDQNNSFMIYVSSWYKPIIVWLLTSVYQIMSMVLQKNYKNKIMYGFTSNKWWRNILRGFMLSLGLWIFYLGLGIGQYQLQNNI